MAITREEIKKELDKLIYDVMGEYEEFITDKMRDEMVDQVFATVSRHKVYRECDLKRSFRSVLASKLKG